MNRPQSLKTLVSEFEEVLLDEGQGSQAGSGMSLSIEHSFKTFPIVVTFNFYYFD